MRVLCSLCFQLTDGLAPSVFRQGAERCDVCGRHFTSINDVHLVHNASSELAHKRLCEQIHAH